MIRLWVVIVIVLAIVGCANPINRRTYQIYMTAGQMTAERSDLQLAKQNYSRAIVNSQIGHLSWQERASAYFQYARILGNLCEVDKAEKAFIEANRLAEEANGTGSEATYVTVAELAQFNYDIGRYGEAVSYFNKSLPIAERFGIAAKYPASFSGVYSDYADALEKTGDNTRAAVAMERASELKSQAPNQPEEYTRYPTTCEWHTAK